MPGSVVTTLEDELDPPGTVGRGVSLREAVRDAAPGERITFDRSVFGKEGTIALDAAKGEIVIDKNLELDASTLPQGITLRSSSNGYRKLSIGQKAAVSLKRISFTAAATASGIREGPGGAIENEGALTLMDCRFIKNGGGANGGAIFSQGALTMERCVFEGNESQHIGGALCVKLPDVPVRIVHCLFKGNVSHGGGGGAIHVAGRGVEGKIILEHCTFTGNAATASLQREVLLVKEKDRGAGGAIRIERGEMEITQCIIAGNKSVIPGGENISGAFKQVGTNFIGSDPKDAPAGLGANVK